MNNNPLYSDSVQTSDLEAKEGVFGEQKDEIHTKENPQNQGNLTTDFKISTNPLVVNSFGEVSKIERMILHQVATSVHRIKGMVLR